MSPRWRKILLAGVVLVVPGLAQAQPPAPPAAVAQLEDLNRRLVAAVDTGRTARSSALDAELDAMAGARTRLLLSLMDTAPGDVLRLALPAATRAALPARARSQTEETADLTGSVEVAYEDSRAGARLRHVLVTTSGRVSLHFATPPPDWATGARVRVRGVRVQDALALNGDSSAVATLAAAAAATPTGAQSTLVILVNFQDNPSQPYTAAHASNVVFSTTSSYLHEVSAGRTWLTGEVVPWSTIALSSGVCDANTLATLAKQAAVAAGKDLAQYSRFIYGFPTNACSWWGFGSVGGSPSNAWVNGDIALEVAGHELGHNLGLYHSRNMDCGAAAVGGTCTVDEYGDTLDLMGATRGHFNAFQKERLGWFSTGQVQAVTTSGQYAIEPLSAPSAGVKALKILKSTDAATGRRTYYYVELRQGLGVDAFMSGWTNVMTGVAVHLGTEATANSSYLLDMTPETPSWYDPALVGSRTFTDAAAGLSISTVGVSSNGATVSLIITPPSCARVAPTVTLSPGAPAAVDAGTMLSYTITATNNDSATCAPATFAVAPAVPSGWSASLDTSSLVLSPGASASTLLRVTSPLAAAPAIYSAGVSLTGTADVAHVATGAASYTVRAPLTLAVATDKASYTRTETVATTARVMAGTVPAANVPVTIQVRKADGKTVTSTSATDANGYVTYRLRLGRKDPLGTYQSTASSAGVAPAIVSFTVR